MSKRPISITLIAIGMLSLCDPVCPQDFTNSTFLTQMLSEARTQAGTVKDEVSRKVLLENLAATQARVGNISLAMAEAERLDCGTCSYIYEQILLAQARAGDFEAAYHTAQRIRGGEDEGVFAAASDMARHGRVSQAISLIDQTSRPENVRRRAQAFLEFGAAAAKTGNTLQAAALFDKAEALSVEFRQEGGIQAATIELPLEVASTRLACGNVAGAARIFSEYRSLIDGIKDDSKRQQYMYALSAAAARGRDFDLAKQVLAEITSPMRRAQAGAEIVREYLAEGPEDTEAAFSIAAEIPGLEARLSSLGLVASAQARRGERDAARKTIEICERLLKEASENYRPWGTLFLASAEYELGDRTRAASLSDQAIALAGGFTIHAERERASLLNEIVRLRTGFGDEDGALMTARQAGSDLLFRDIAEVEAEKGRAASAFKWAEALKDPEQKANALLGIVRGALDKEQSTQASGKGSLPRCGK